MLDGFVQGSLIGSNLLGSVFRGVAARVVVRLHVLNLFIITMSQSISWEFVVLVVGGSGE